LTIILIENSYFSPAQAIPTNGIPYLDYITPGVLLQSTIFVSVFYGLTIVWERETGILKKLLVTPASRYATVTVHRHAGGNL
jgi:ABC-2 type transport system permease protein